MAISVILWIAVLILGRLVGGEGYSGAIDPRTFQVDGRRVWRFRGQ